MLLRLKSTLIAMLFAMSGAVAQSPDPVNDSAAIADLRVAIGNKDIAKAWLINPTDRYDHFVQGSDYEAGGLRLLMADGRQLTLVLDNNQVFEDRQPRLADLDGDGRDEIILVLTSLSEGASLAAFSVDGENIVLKAKTPFIEQPYRWLNPAGIGDFDGDGQLEVALVAMPHLVKRLEVWRLMDGDFKNAGRFEGFSNHRNGSAFTAMSAVVDFDKDGLVDLILPDSARRAIRVISMVGMRAKEITRIDLSAPANGNFELRKSDNGGTILVPLENGETVEIIF